VGDAEKEENGGLLASVTKVSEYFAAQSGGRHSRQKKEKTRKTFLQITLKKQLHFLFY